VRRSTCVLFWGYLLFPAQPILEHVSNVGSFPDPPAPPRVPLPPHACGGKQERFPSKRVSQGARDSASQAPTPARRRTVRAAPADETASREALICLTLHSLARRSRRIKGATRNGASACITQVPELVRLRTMTL